MSCRSLRCLNDIWRHIDYVLIWRIREFSPRKKKVPNQIPFLMKPPKSIRLQITGSQCITWPLDSPSPCFPRRLSFPSCSRIPPTYWATHWVHGLWCVALSILYYCRPSLWRHQTASCERNELYFPDMMRWSTRGSITSWPWRYVVEFATD
jgi:hypothetical protein